MKQLPWILLMISVFLFVSYGYKIINAGSSAVQYHPDDAYYYKNIAKNISNGYGSTFDKITKTSGYHLINMWYHVVLSWFHKEKPIVTSGWKDFYADVDAKGGGDGSKEHPWTPEEALKNAESRARILVKGHK